MLTYIVAPQISAIQRTAPKLPENADANNPNPVQPESAIVAIKFTIGLLPAVCAAIAMLIF